MKQCYSCTKKLTKEYFTVPAWKASKPERRVCLHCQKKGKWNCAHCHQKLPAQQFSHYSKMRPAGGQNGRQMCDACHAAAVQATLRKRAAQTTAQRVQPLRKKLRLQQTLRETWEAIATHVSARQQQQQGKQQQGKQQQEKQQQGKQQQGKQQQGKQQQGKQQQGKQQQGKQQQQQQQQQQQEEEEEQEEQARERQTELQAKGDDADAAGQEKGNSENTIAANARWRTYRCPACNAEVQSTVVNGKVHSRGHCGRQFRVAAGVVCRSYLHACPTCNTTVETTKPDGRIQKQHKDSTGRLCKTSQWKSAGPVSDA